jgi:hypothetical protein
MKYRKTELGRQSFKDHNNQLSGRQRSAFILIDGLKDEAVILKALAPTGLDAADIQHLVGLGLIESVDTVRARPEVASTGGGPATDPQNSEYGTNALPVLSEQEIYQRAYPVASRLTSGLGLRGFRLNLSLESAAGYKDLMALAPKIRDAVGEEKFAELARALRGF